MEQHLGFPLNFQISAAKTELTKTLVVDLEFGFEVIISVFI